MGVQQIQQITDVVAAVGGGGLQIIGLAAMNSTQIALEDFSLGQVGSLDGRVFGMDALAQGLGSMARAAHDDVGMGDFVFDSFCQHIPARQDTAAEEDHNIHLRGSNSVLHRSLRQT